MCREKNFQNFISPNQIFFDFLTLEVQDIPVEPVQVMTKDDDATGAFKVKTGSLKEKNQISLIFFVEVVITK